MAKASFKQRLGNQFTLRSFVMSWLMYIPRLEWHQRVSNGKNEIDGKKTPRKICASRDRVVDSYKYLSISKLYPEKDIRHIDNTTVKNALRFLELTENHPNRLVRESAALSFDK